MLFLFHGARHRSGPAQTPAKRRVRVAIAVAAGVVVAAPAASMYLQSRATSEAFAALGSDASVRVVIPSVAQAVEIPLAVLDRAERRAASARLPRGGELTPRAPTIR